MITNSSYIQNRNWISLNMHLIKFLSHIVKVEWNSWFEICFACEFLNPLFIEFDSLHLSRSCIKIVLSQYFIASQCLIQEPITSFYSITFIEVKVLHCISSSYNRSGFKNHTHIHQDLIRKLKLERY